MQNISTTPGLEIYDLQPGTGAEAVAGKTVTAHYVGTLADGTKFDSSLDRGEPFSFTLGAGQVIQGWDLGIQGMKIGSVRRLVIAPELGYGDRAIGPIPAGSTLVFEVQLLDVK
ncbi:MAG: FKBP-type peptidyl-prolyl cis-trans isomerase [Candidatus Taylorbacteria bacterium]|nr:FKBP-type peptidyl-prolyl cis-trans isomerase [Candidatus Taylorbacteria bacterium]